MASLQKSVHPEYTATSDNWRQMRDTYAGQRTVKLAGQLYLPPTAGMILDGAIQRQEPGHSSYMAYGLRAVFPEVVDEAVRIMVGIMHREAAEIELPSVMEPLLKSATRKGEGLMDLLRRINLNQLVYGRMGLLLDIAENADLPHIVTYSADSITNWDDWRGEEVNIDSLNFVVTTEDAWTRGVEEEARAVFDWDIKTRYRAFHFNDEGFYETFVEQDNEIVDEAVPDFGGRKLDFLPFTFIGAQDINPSVGPIPLLGLSNMALAIYRGEADYRQGLHMMSQDTLVISGSTKNEDDPDEATRLGAGAKIELPEGGDAKFIGVNSKGLPEQRKSLEDDRKEASSMGSRLLENTGSQAESGEALRIRVAAKTTTLHTIAIAGAQGLENTLRQMAMWIGANPDEVKVVPNTDFVEDKPKPEDLVQVMTAKGLGAPISLKSIHENIRKSDMTTMTMEEEVAELKKEAELFESLRVTPEPPVANQENETPDNTENEEE